MTVPDFPSRALLLRPCREVWRDQRGLQAVRVPCRAGKYFTRARAMSGRDVIITERHVAA